MYVQLRLMHSRAGTKRGVSAFTISHSVEANVPIQVIPAILIMEELKLGELARVSISAHTHGRQIILGSPLWPILYSPYISHIAIEARISIAGNTVIGPYQTVANISGIPTADVRMRAFNLMSRALCQNVVDAC